MRNQYFGILMVFLSVVFTGCQKDDICPEGTDTTPLLQIEFYDAENPETLKVVQNLTVIAVGETEAFIGPSTVNNIAIPLKTNQSFTEYRFISNSGTDLEKEEIIRFDYLPTSDYVNRACGFKINFLDLTLRRETEGDQWIISQTVNIEDIENDTATHISFTH